VTPWLIQYPSLTAPVLTPDAASTAGGGIGSSASRLWQYSALAGPVLALTAISDVTALPRLPASNPVRKRLHASKQTAWFFDTQWEAPAAATVPELPWVNYSFRPTRTYRTALYVAPHPEFGVQVDVPVMSWTGWYDWRHPRWAKKRHASAMPAYFQDTVLFPDVVVAPDLSVATYPERVQRRRRVAQFPQPSWPPFTADVSVTAPPLSWNPEYPDRLFPKRALHARHQRAFEMWPQEIPVTAVSPVTGGRGYYVVPPRKRDFIVPPRRRKFTVN
jgi:hypothetical protein